MKWTTKPYVNCVVVSKFHSTINNIRPGGFPETNKKIKKMKKESVRVIYTPEHGIYVAGVFYAEPRAIFGLCGTQKYDVSGKLQNQTKK